MTGDPGRAFETGEGLVMAELIGGESVLVYANPVPDGGKISVLGGSGFGADGTLRFRFWDGYGAPGRAAVRRDGDTLEVVLTRDGPSLQGERPEKARSYGTHRLTKTACAGRAVEAFEAHRYFGSGDFDDWRYVPGRGGRTAAELVAWGSIEDRPPTVIFRVTCEPRRHTLLFEYFPGEDPRKWVDWARETGLELTLIAPNEEEGRAHHMLGPLTSRTVTGRLVLTDELRRQVAAAETILLYGENGPSNDWNGGRAEALRRLVRECAV